MTTKATKTTKTMRRALVAIALEDNGVWYGHGTNHHRGTWSSPAYARLAEVSIKRATLRALVVRGWLEVTERRQSTDTIRGWTAHIFEHRYKVTAAGAAMVRGARAATAIMRAMRVLSA